MNAQLPNFKFQSKSPDFNRADKRAGCLKMDGKIVHDIENLHVFYASLGYTHEAAMAGNLPDEYIWETFFRYCTKGCNACFQIKLLEYLTANSASFNNQYKLQSANWLEQHRATKAACSNLLSPACSMQTGSHNSFNTAYGHIDVIPI